MNVTDPDYWYINRDQLAMGMIFRTASGQVIMLDGHVPGDGTKMYVAELHEGDWLFQDSTIEPGDLAGAPLNEKDVRP